MRCSLLETRSFIILLLNKSTPLAAKYTFSSSTATYTPTTGVRACLCDKLKIPGVCDVNQIHQIVR